MSVEDEVLRWLVAGAGEAEPADRVVETSCARIVLTGDTAWKIKRVVSFGFLDFSTAEQRAWAVERELAFNRLTAPNLYRRVRQVRRDRTGRLSLDGVGEPVESVLEMRRFADDAVLAAAPGRLDGHLAEQLGRTVARFHRDSPASQDAGGIAALRYTVASNADLLRSLADMLGVDAVERLMAATEAETQRLTPLLEARRRAGFGRRCHGDLHLGNVLVEDGDPVLFDCIEFNDRLSAVDVLYDLAFLLMDLVFRDRRAEACRALDGWLDEAARSFGPEVYDGLAALPLFMSVRAAVRCHVVAQTGEIETARAYLAAAQAHLAPAPPVLLAVGGLSGSGKSTFARARAPALGAAPGAVVLRSDEIRKRLWGADPLDRLPPEAYAPEQSTLVYAALFDSAARCLVAGRAAALDAVFLKPEERALAEALALDHGVPFTGVWLEADAAALAARVTARSGDASDADARVVAAQLERDPGPITWAVHSSQSRE